jgi:DNA recombination protein RmuC
MVAWALVILLVAALAGTLVLLARARLLEAARARLLEQRLAGIEDTIGRGLGDLDAKVDRRLEGLDTRLLSTQQSAGQTATQIAEKLGRVEGATAQMLARANDLARLEQALRPPKARGGFGELLLENLLRDRLPVGAYELQYGFSTGERVDAVVKVERLIPIDAKFPLDNFERLVAAETDGERALYEKAFARDLKGHVDAVASKYIRPAEDTYDFALLYLPSEAVYYELVCGRTGALLRYAHDKRVFPVSPTTFTSQLQVIALGLKGLQIEERAHEVMAYCAQLQRDFTRFRDDFDVVGKHLGHAQSKYSEAERRLTRFETKLESATERADSELEAEPVQRALDAA